MLALMSLVSATHGFQPSDRTTLKTAVEAWCTDEAAATTVYGDINTWDVRTRICTFSSCCPPHPRLTNVDYCPHTLLWSCISQVSLVTDMSYIFGLFTDSSFTTLSNCGSLFNSDISNWNTGRVINME
jgi:surface protein